MVSPNVFAGMEGMAQVPFRSPDYFCGFLQSHLLRPLHARESLSRPFSAGFCCIQAGSHLLRSGRGAPGGRCSLGAESWSVKLCMKTGALMTKHEHHCLRQPIALPFVELSSRRDEPSRGMCCSKAVEQRRYLERVFCAPTYPLRCSPSGSEPESNTYLRRTCNNPSREITV